MSDDVDAEQLRRAALARRLSGAEVVREGPVKTGGKRNAYQRTYMKDWRARQRKRRAAEAAELARLRGRAGETE